MAQLVRLPVLEVLRIRVLALLWGLWVLFRRLLKGLLSGASSTDVSLAPSPPDCLIGTNLGRHTFLKVKGIKLHYVEAGHPREPLLLLLHGFPDLWITWRYQLPELSKYYRVVALDMKGFGDSDKPTSRSNYDIRKLVEELKEVILSLGYKKCILVGHDLGGLMGWHLVHMAPQMVDKFIVISAPHPNLYWGATANNLHFDSHWIQFCQLPVLPEIKALENDLCVIDSVYQHLDNTIENKSFLSAYKYSFSRKEDWTGALNYFRTAPLWRLEAAESGVEVPTLLLVGNRATPSFFEGVVRSADYLVKYSLKVVENAGHYPHHERPSEVNKIILTFLLGHQQVVGEKPSANGLVSRMLRAGVSTTLSYGNGVFDVVKKANKTGLSAISLGHIS